MSYSMNENGDGKIFKGTVRLWIEEFEVTAKNEDDACKKILAKAERQLYIPKLVSNDWDETEDNWGKKERVHWDDE